MAIGLTVNGTFMGIDPAFPTVVYTNRTKIGEWEEIEVHSVNSTRLAIRFKAANRWLTVTPDNKFESRPTTNPPGEWEQFERSGTTIYRPGIVAGPQMVLVGFNTLEPLRIIGQNFVHPDGSRRVLRGISQFFAFRKYLDGDRLTDLIQESKDLKFDMWRVWFMGSKKQNTIADINPLDKGVLNQIRPFVDYIHAQGILVNGNAMVDAQDVVPDYSQRISLWQAEAEQLHESGVLFSYGNQRDKNGTPKDDMVDPKVLWSRGSWTADPDPFQPQPNGASFAEFHPRRDMPASLFDTVASPVTLLNRDKVTVPLIISEPPKFGVDGYDADLARRFAQHYSAEVAGVVFHNYFSQRSLVMDENTRRIAQSWQSRIFE